MKIRAESVSDHDAIRRVTEAAFALAAHADGNEGRIIDALRSRGELCVSLVAERDGEVIGHVAVSPVVLDDGTAGWFGLGPVAVNPGQQRQGIGDALVRAALASLHELGARGCVVLGDPGYYARFGFGPSAPLHLDGVPAEYFMTQSFSGPTPAASVRYSPAFYVA